MKFSLVALFVFTFIFIFILNGLPASAGTSLVLKNTGLYVFDGLFEVNYEKATLILNNNIAQAMTQAFTPNDLMASSQLAKDLKEISGDNTLLHILNLSPLSNEALETTNPIKSGFFLSSHLAAYTLHAVSPAPNGLTRTPVSSVTISLSYNENKEVLSEITIDTKDLSLTLNPLRNSKNFEFEIFNLKARHQLVKAYLNFKKRFGNVSGFVPDISFELFLNTDRAEPYTIQRGHKVDPVVTLVMLENWIDSFIENNCDQALNK